jgi:protein SCO1/2
MVFALTLASAASAQMMGGGIMKTSIPPSSQTLDSLKTVTIEQRLNEQVPADLTFHDESGRIVRLGDYYGHKPLILNLQYFQCQMLCGEVTNGLVASLKTLKFDVNKEFGVLSVSFDPRETVEMAADKKKSTLQRYHRDGAEAGWLQLPVRSQVRPVGARRRHHAAHYRRQNFALLLRRRVCAEGSAAGID